MRDLIRSGVLFGLVVLLAGCNSGSSNSSPSSDMSVGTGGNGNGGGGGTGGGPIADMTRPSGNGGGGGGGGGGSGTFQCGNMTCGGGTVCCVTGTTPTCMKGCPDGGFVAECRSPSDCGGNPCCITVTTGFMVHDVSCMKSTSECVPAVAPNGQGKDRACNVDKDCTDGVATPSLPDCCTNTQTMQKVCFSKMLTGPGGIQGWTCP